MARGRRYVFVVGGQASGKTFQLKNAIRHEASLVSVTAVFVCDRLNEYRDAGVIFKSYEEYITAVSLSDEIPRVCVFQLGTDVKSYDVVFREAIEQGGVTLVIDEAYQFVPGGGGGTWRGSEDLQSIVLAGRHLENVDGKMCVVHLYVAAQYPRNCDTLLHSQAYTVMCGTIEGENAASWVKENTGVDGKVELARVRALGKWEWTCLRGTRPDWWIGAP